MLYMISVFLFWVGQSLYLPTLPLYVKTKIDDLSMVGVVLSMYGLWQTIVRIPLGIASDWTGRRKPFILGGFICLGLGNWMMGAAGHISLLILGRMLTGIAVGVWVLLVVGFTSLFPASEVIRAAAMITLVSSFGRMSGALLTGVLNTLSRGYTLAFFLAAAAATAGASAMLPLHEPHRTPKRSTLRGLWQLLRREDVWLPSCLNIVVQYASWASVFGFVPILAQQLGVSDVSQSMLVSVNIVCVVLGNAVSSCVITRSGPYQLMYSSFVLTAAGLIAAALATGLPALWCASFAIGLSWGIGYPLFMGLSVEFVAEEQRSTAMGMHQAIYGLGMFAGPWLSGIFADLSGIRPMLAGTALVCTGLGIFGSTRLMLLHQRLRSVHHQQ